MSRLPFKKLLLFSLILVPAALLALVGSALAEQARVVEERPTVEELMKRIDILSEEVEALKKGEEGGGTVRELARRIRLGGYGELDLIAERDKNIKFDPHRFVLYVGVDFADWIKLESETEFEHGGTGPAGSRFDGEVEIEQLHLNFLFHDAFNIRAGVLLIPGSRINLYHEPIYFNSTERPYVDQFLIPSTWMESAFGIYGSLFQKARYQLYIAQGLDGTDFNASNGIRGGRQNLRKNNNNALAVTGRLDVTPLIGLDTAFSFYTSPASDNGKSTTTLYEFDAKYSIGPFDILGEAAFINIDDPAILVAQGAKNIGEKMWGYYIEGAYHYLPKTWKRGRLAKADGVLFARFSDLDTQAGNLPAGVTRDGRFRRNIWTTGFTFKPVPAVVFKFDFERVEDQSTAAPLNNDKFQFTLGFAF